MKGKISNLITKVKGGKFSIKKIIIIVVALLLIATAVTVFFMFKNKKIANMEVTTSTVKVAKGTIINVVEGSGVLEANEQYDITALVSGDIVADYFSEGDMVLKDQVLYSIDSSSIEKNIQKSTNSLTQATLSYNEAKKSLDDLNCKATAGGTITNIYVKTGDKIANGAKICDILNDETMTLTLPFLASQADGFSIGQAAKVEILGDSGSYSGTVSAIAGSSQVNPYGVVVKNVEIAVKNPGGIMNTDTATAIIGGAACTTPGGFEYAENITLTAEISGTIKKINYIEGDKVSEGNIVAVIENESVVNQVTKAELSLKDARLSLDNLKDDKEQYAIKAPIDGKIIQKNAKAGDKLGQSSSGSNIMAVIADMSKYKLTINIDELEVSSLHVGQRATITADAVEGQMFEGYVNNISIIGTSQNGVTTYPVEIVLENVEETGLIPGMNVDTTIVIEEKKDILLLPANAINRGNTVTKDGEKVQVEIGISDGKMVEIISGLSEGDEVTVEAVRGQQGGAAGMGMGGMMGGMPGMGGGMPGMGGMSGNRSGAPGGMSGNRSGAMGGMSGNRSGAPGGMSGNRSGAPGGMMR